MNLSKSEFGNRDLRSRGRDEGQAFQPADGDCTSSLPSLAEGRRAAARDGSPTPALWWCDQTWRNLPIERWRSDTVHTEVQRQEAAASPRALEGRQRVAQGKRGEGPLAPPWVKSSNQVFPLPPNRMLFGDSGGEAGREGKFLANWRGLRFVGLRMILGSRPGSKESARPRPLTPTLSPNTEDVSGEREKTRGTLTQGVASGSCRSGSPGLQAYAPLGLYKEEAASCRFTSVQSLALDVRVRLRDYGKVVPVGRQECRHKRVRPASPSNFGILARLCLGFLLSTPLLAQTPVECVRVVSKSIDRQVRLPGELSPYLSVPIYARVAGFVDRVDVDRGSVVKKGQVLATLVAPETETQIAEASSKAQAVQLQRTEAAAKLSAAQSTYNRLKAASQTPGVVAGNDLEVAEKNVEAAEALVNAYEGSIKAAEASVQSLKALEKYLTITAPFDGIITDRTVHPGTLAGPNSGTGGLPLLKLEQLNRLRLTVAVPEAQVGGIVKNARVPFTLPAFPGETFHGTVRRIAHALEPKTRTMAVELDVANPGFRLASGMYAEVLWPVRKERPALLVPPTTIATTTERTFVIRIKNDVAEWVTVSRGAAAGDLVEVYGALQDSDLIARRGTDELREGTRIKVALPKQ